MYLLTMLFIIQDIAPDSAFPARELKIPQIWTVQHLITPVPPGFSLMNPLSVGRISFFVKLKIARPDSSQNFMDMAKTNNLTHLGIQKTNTVVFLFIHTSNLYKNPKQKTCQQ